MTPGIRVLERDRRFTPLGIRFWDAALEVPIANTLSVHAWRSGGSSPPVPAVRSPGGVYSFHGLPDQAAAEKPAASERFPERVGPPRDYVVAVDDPSGTYLPVAFTVTLPLGYRGEFLGATAASPPVENGRAYLFAAPGRLAPPGLVAIRADLVDAVTEEPAAWATLSATLLGESSLGIANQDGRVLVLLQLPTPDRLQQGSPPVGGAPASWPVTLSARWEPNALRYPFAGGGDLDPDWATRPSLKSILDEQGAATIWTADVSAPVDEWTETLVHGQELVLRTTLASGETGSTLWISAATSPP